MRLKTPTDSVQKLQNSLHAKAKAEPVFRFYTLWDKVSRADVIEEAYRRCRANDGAPGIDGVTFDKIEAQGRKQWLETIIQELRDGSYRPQPLLRVWIPKSNGGRRALGIPSIRDRTVMMAAVLVIGPIFEADLLDNQYGFRPELDAKMAVRRAFWHIKDGGRREVVDADLRDYFTSIPHPPLMRSLSRRIADGRILHIIKGWLTAPVVEVIEGPLVGAGDAAACLKTCQVPPKALMPSPWASPFLPLSSASSIRALATRSLTEPVGLRDSSLAQMRTPGLGLRRLSSTSGVCPIAWMMSP